MAALPCNALQCLTSKYFFQTDGTRRLAQIVDVIRRMLGSLPLHAKFPSDFYIFEWGNCTRELSRWWQESDMYAVFQYGDVKDLVTKVEWQLSNLAYTCCKWPWLSYINEAMKQQKFQLYYKSKFIFLHFSGKALFVHFTVWKHLLNERYKTFLSWSTNKEATIQKSERRIHVITHSWG